MDVQRADEEDVLIVETLREESFKKRTTKSIHMQESNNILLHKHPRGTSVHGCPPHAYIFAKNEIVFAIESWRSYGSPNREVKADAKLRSQTEGLTEIRDISCKKAGCWKFGLGRGRLIDLSLCNINVAFHKNSIPSIFVNFRGQFT